MIFNPFRNPSVRIKRRQWNVKLTMDGSTGKLLVLLVDVTRSAVFFPVRVNQSDPVWFSLDSGAGNNYIDLSTARRLGLRSISEGTVRGAGAGTVPVERLEPVSFSLDNRFASSDHEMNAVDLSPVQETWGRRLDGFFGFDFLSRYTVTIDYLLKRLIIIEPNRFHYSGRGESIPLVFEGRLPLVSGEIEVAGNAPLQDRFLVDSGSQDEVDHPIIAKSSEGTSPTDTGVGLGKPVPGVLGRVSRFRLGKFELKNLQGAAGGMGIGSKLIGGGVLSRFRVTFDYARQRMILEAPSPRVP